MTAVSRQKAYGRWHKNIQTFSDTFTLGTRLLSVSWDNSVQLLVWSNCFPFFCTWTHRDITLDSVNSMLFTWNIFCMLAHDCFSLNFIHIKSYNFKILHHPWSQKPMQIYKVPYTTHQIITFFFYYKVLQVKYCHVCRHISKKALTQYLV